MLYGCVAWTLTKNLEGQIRSCQRKMLRSILGSGRRRCDNNEVEPWVEWIQRTTREAERRAGEVNVEDWVTTARRRKHRWANRVATLECDRWAARAARWEPNLCTATYKKAARAQGRPKKRWEDDLQHFCSNVLATNRGWLHDAQEKNAWGATEALFLQSLT